MAPWGGSPRPAPLETAGAGAWGHRLKYSLFDGDENDRAVSNS